MAIRPARNVDRQRIKDLLHGREAAIDDPQMSINVLVERGSVTGISIWWSTFEDRIDVVVNTDNAVTRDNFYELFLAACEEALTAGYTRGGFLLKSLAIREVMLRDFNWERSDVNFILSAGNDQQGNVTRWRMYIDLADAKRQLLARFGRDR